MDFENLGKHYGGIMTKEAKTLALANVKPVGKSLVSVTVGGKGSKAIVLTRAQFEQFKRGLER